MHPPLSYIHIWHASELRIMRVQPYAIAPHFDHSCVLRSFYRQKRSCKKVPQQPCGRLTPTWATALHALALPSPLLCFPWLVVGNVPKSVSLLVRRRLHVSYETVDPLAPPPPPRAYIVTHDTVHLAALRMTYLLQVHLWMLSSIGGNICLV